ncbi:MAG: hypothetical protein M9890_01070 [Thermomicrobiales bacterium]|nr:hypothetical protein [Thermomicrobiales bacterium]
MSAMPSLTIDVTDHIASLREELQMIETRLEEGYRMIDEALVSGKDVSHWERHWLKLLSDYERLYDALVA